MDKKWRALEKRCPPYPASSDRHIFMSLHVQDIFTLQIAKNVFEIFFQLIEGLTLGYGKTGVT
jgi:hypothetical protein